MNQSGQLIKTIQGTQPQVVAGGSLLRRWGRRVMVQVRLLWLGLMMGGGRRRWKL